MNAVPIPAGAAAANDQYPIVIFDRAELDLVFVVIHNEGTLSTVIDRRYSKRPICNVEVSLAAATYATECRVSRTRYQVIVDHARRLHQRVANRRADEFESAPQQIAAHRVGFGCPRGHVGHVPPAILDWLADDEAPQVLVEAFHFFTQREERLRILDSGSDLQSVSHDPGVPKQPLHIACAVAGDLLRAESIECVPIVRPFLQN